ncbi:DUF125-domain-containing protein [Aureobasidium pullulans]|uniref:DUF125-domain-containing protein n=1 Tax=Aureobasidium pullulans TaxID=5580 RepID=A0A4S9ZFL9_AURPU|nr:DUF125-domain-containing protein [Aureobasidium pullulans]THW72099.1 DUF125-domain-containing protein [Aureobasidium pullulans]THY85192.1 DUF125-domain-containing protein [Aureobasidium pullulans]THZ58916.1 DUF125-domain-containing protein [Aureobasidium pullulans]TIA04983.1 DUF125-domain-containing protein [Aureobasidium pullulans]
MALSSITSFLRSDTSGTYSPLPTSSRSDSEKQSPSEFTTAYSKPSKWHQRIDPRTISDLTLGLSDGLTVPFALTAGLAALGDTKIVVFAGLAELMAGSISMGIGGYLGASGEAQSAATTKASTIAMVYTSPAEARAAVISTLECYVSASLLDAVATEITSAHDKTINFLLEHHHRFESADVSPRLYTSALCIAFGYFFGGLIPLLPYVFIEDGGVALVCSVVVMVFTLFGFGVGKTAVLGERRWGCRIVEGLKMVGLGGSAAAASVLCVRLVHQ